MAHFAEIDAENVVVRVLVIADDQEHRGQEYLADDLGLGGVWLQTSYNTHGGVHLLGGTPLRYNYAGAGSSWDGTGFAAPQPFASWTLDGDYLWQPPTAMPDDGTLYEWDEDSATWVVA